MRKEVSEELFESGNLNLILDLYVKFPGVLSMLSLSKLEISSRSGLVSKIFLFVVVFSKPNSSCGTSGDNESREGIFLNFG